MKDKGFVIQTLGCKVNQYESFAIRDALIEHGLLERAGDAELVVVNTCAVTGPACHQSRQVISRLMRQNPSARLYVTGCYADLYPGELMERFDGACLIPNHLKLRIPELIRGISKPLAEFPQSRFPSIPPLRMGRSRAYLKVQDGCEASCSYCVVPMARGKYISLPPPDVLSQVDLLVRSGFQEVVLTGIHLGKYGVDLGGPHLVGLILEILGHTKILRLRLSSLEPREISMELVELIAKSGRICRHLHIPLQSGSDEILSLMNRDYNTQAYKEILFDVVRQVPDCGIGADVIVGFPFEDETQFQRTFTLLESLPITYLHVFPYSPRENTPAFSLKKRASVDEVKRRVGALRQLGEKKKREFMEGHLGKWLEVLLEREGEKGVLLGHTENYLPASCDGTNRDLVGRWVMGRAVDIRGGQLVIGDIAPVDQ